MSTMPALAPMNFIGPALEGVPFIAIMSFVPIRLGDISMRSSQLEL